MVSNSLNEVCKIMTVRAFKYDHGLYRKEFVLLGLNSLLIKTLFWKNSKQEVTTEVVSLCKTALRKEVYFYTLNCTRILTY